MEAPRHASCRLRRAWSGGQDDARRVMPTASGAIFGWYEWIPHPSATRKWPQVDHRRMTDDRVALGSASSTRGVRRFFSSPHSSASLGLCAGHVSGASHTPTRNAKPCQTSDGSRPPAALGSPHSDERSDQIRSTYPLRGPGRVQVSDSFTQPCSAYESHTCICKLST